MPIEITELIVRANVNDQPNAKNTGKSNSNNSNSTEHCDTDLATLEIKKSVDTILDVLKRKNER